MSVRHKFRARVFEVGEEIGGHVWGGVALTHDSDPKGDDPLCIPLPIEALRKLGALLGEKIEVEVTFRSLDSSGTPSE